MDIFKHFLAGMVIESVLVLAGKELGDCPINLSIQIDENPFLRMIPYSNLPVQIQHPFLVTLLWGHRHNRSYT